MWRAGALAAYNEKLSSYEQEEILEYKHVWFCGLDAKKIDQVRGLNLKASAQQPQAGGSGGSGPNAVNFGFDDENGYYIMVRAFLLTNESTAVWASANLKLRNEQLREHVFKGSSYA